MRKPDEDLGESGRYRAERWAILAESLSKASSPGLRQQQFGGTPSMPLLPHRAMPWAITAAAIIAVIMLLSRADARPPIGATPHLPSAGSATEMADHLASQQEDLNRLAARVEALSQRIAASPGPKVWSSSVPEKPAGSRRKVEPRADPGSRSPAALEQDLDKLRQYFKDVADSVAVLDTQMSDPAVLQKKLEHQRALSRP